MDSLLLDLGNMLPDEIVLLDGCLGMREAVRGGDMRGFVEAEA